MLAGAGRKTRVHQVRGCSPLFLCNEAEIVSELSIFIDESGDFGTYDIRSPYYIITMVFHDQSCDISEPIAKLRRDLSNLGIDPDHSVHTGPIIRREKEYECMPIDERRRILNSMVTFIRHCNIKYHCIHIDKKHIADSVELSAKLSKKLSEFIAEHTSELVEPECVKIYYDNGQTEVTRILVSVFNALLPRIEIKRVLPSDYRLFQAADMFCSMELITLKLENSSISASEIEFFGNLRDLKKNYLKPLAKFEWK